MVRTDNCWYTIAVHNKHFYHSDHIINQLIADPAIWNNFHCRRLVLTENFPAVLYGNAFWCVNKRVSTAIYKWCRHCCIFVIGIMYIQYPIVYRHQVRGKITDRSGSWDARNSSFWIGWIGSELSRSTLAYYGLFDMNNLVYAYDFSEDRTMKNSLFDSYLPVYSIWRCKAVIGKAEPSAEVIQERKET